MAKKENWRAHSNGITAEIPNVCNVMSFGKGIEKTVVTSYAPRGIVPEEIALGQVIRAAGGRGVNNRETR